MRRTRDSIMAAFAQLLDERPMNKIIVKDIVERCGINRNTFYYHFPDIPTLLQTMMEEKVNALISTHCTFGHPLDCIRPALQYGKTHKQAVLHVYRAVPRETFLLYMNRLAQHIVDEYFDTISKTVSIPIEDAKILNRYYKCMVVGCLLDWLDAAMRYDLEANMERVCFLLDGAGEHAIQKAVEQAVKG